MPVKALIVIETENAFIQNFTKALRAQQVRDYEVIQVVPEFTDGLDVMTQKCMERIRVVGINKQIAAFFIDLSVESQIADSQGIDIGLVVRQYYPDTPVFCITHKSRHESNFDLMGDASLEDFDGVFEKNYLLGRDFSKSRFRNLLEKAEVKRFAMHGGSVPPAKRPDTSCDVAIVTALYEFEHQQVLNFVEVDEELSRKIGNWFTKIGKIKDSSLTVVVAFQERMGSVDAAIVATTLLAQFQPKLLIMTGVCAGRSSKGVEPGHIVIPNTVYYYQSGKFQNNDFLPYPNRVNLEPKLIQMAKNWQIALFRQMEDYVTKEGEKIKIRTARLHCDVMASGTLVLKTDGSLDDISEILDEKTIAVEMESFGIARSCDLDPYKAQTKALIIKSCMDNAGGSKNDDHKEWAAFMSSSFAYFFVKRLETEGYFAGKG